MKKANLILALLFIILPILSFAEEMGLRVEIISSYSGSVEIFEDQSENLNGAGIPYSIYVISDFLKYSFTHYEMYASDKYSSDGYTGRGSVLISNDIFAVEYFKSISETAGIRTYGSAGIGLFKSSSVGYEYVPDGISWITNGGASRSSNNFDPGFVASLGAKKTFEKSFVGAEFNYINKSIKTENDAGGDTPDPIDIGGYMISFTTGILFW